MADTSAAPRLSSTTALSGLAYDRARVTPGIVHLGVGAFCRAHVAAYVDDVLQTDPSWGIVGISLKRADTRDALQPQDFLYALAVRSGNRARLRVIGSILDVLDATTQRNAVVAAMADPRVRIVTLTVTEKGYCHDPATGRLDPPPRRHPTFHRPVLRQPAVKWRDRRAHRHRLRRASWTPLLRTISTAMCPSRRPWWIGSSRRPPTMTGGLSSMRPASGTPGRW